MKFHGREAEQIENESLRITVLAGGGHIAEILDKRTGVSPLWVPPWTSIEPADYEPARNPEYGSDSESKLLAGIMGHNLCLDMFGPPSTEEAAAGFTVHGDGSVARYRLSTSQNELHAATNLEHSGLNFERTIRLDDDGSHLQISESVENLLPLDRPIAWTQHVTLGPPFLEPGVTHVVISPEHSRTMDPPAWGDGLLKTGTDFHWPDGPAVQGGSLDLSTYSSQPASRFTTHLMGGPGKTASFEAINPRLGLAFGYQWNCSDFPWLGMWEENDFRESLPWSRRTRTWGMEFGASPFAETRRAMIDRGRLLGAPCYRWLAARGRVHVEYTAWVRHKH